MKNRFKRKEILKSWCIAGGYLLLILSTLYIAPTIWDVTIEFVDSKIYYLADIGTVAILGTLLFGIIWEDIAYRKVRDVFRYIWLFIIGWALFTIMHKIPGGWNRMHIPEYVLVGCLIFRAAYYHIKTKVIYPLIFGAVSIFALLEEFIQGCLPNRTCDLKDFGMDAVSIVFALAILDLAVQPEFKKSFIEHVLKKFFHINVARFNEIAYTNTRYFLIRIKMRLKVFLKSLVD